jgi:hypothetical protein
MRQHMCVMATASHDGTSSIVTLVTAVLARSLTPELLPGVEHDITDMCFVQPGCRPKQPHCCCPLVLLANCHVASLLPQVGAVLSQGQQNKRRLMYVWSADGSVQPGTAAWAKKQQQRRQASRTAHTSTTAPSKHQQEQQQQPLTQAAADPQQQQQQVLQAESSCSSTSKKQGGLFGNLFNALLSGLSDDDQQQQQQQQQRRDTSSSQQAAEQGSSAASASSASSQQQSEAEQAGEEEDGEDEQGDDSGVFMYGAAVLSMKGPIALEPVTCQVRLSAGQHWLRGWGGEGGFSCASTNLFAVLQPLHVRGGPCQLRYYRFRRSAFKQCCWAQL